MCSSSWKSPMRAAGSYTSAERARRAGPRWLLAALTYRCPLHCPYCSNPTPAASRDAELSLQHSSRELNGALSGARTFDLKLKAARLIKQHDYPMVLNVVLHRLNIDHGDGILDMAEQLGADYVELANAQYYGWGVRN